MAYTTHDNGDALIPVGVIKDGKARFTVYGEHGKDLLEELHRYEIDPIHPPYAKMIKQF